MSTFGITGLKASNRKDAPKRKRHWGVGNSETEDYWPAIPEKRLAAAVILNGLAAFGIVGSDWNLRNEKSRQETLRWVRGEWEDFVYDFERCCECLQICPMKIRSVIDNAIRDQLWNEYKEF